MSAPGNPRPDRAHSQPVRTCQPAHGDLGLGELEAAKPGNSRRVAAQPVPQEHSRQRTDHRRHRPGSRTASDPLAGEQLLRLGAALHGDAREQADEVDPGGADCSMRPVDDEDPAVRRDQHVVRSQVDVDQRLPGAGRRPLLLHAGEPVEMAIDPRIERGVAPPARARPGALRNRRRCRRVRRPGNRSRPAMG